MSIVLGLFQENIDEVLATQLQIDRIELRETEINIQKKVLEKAYNKSHFYADSEFFKFEIEKLSGEEIDLREKKSRAQDLHKDLVRRVELIKQSTLEYEQE